MTNRSSLRSDYYGAFQIHSLLLDFGDMALSDLDSYYTKNKLDVTKISWKQLSDENRIRILTQIHERDHFKTSISTPFGILIWRCYQVLYRDLNYFTRNFSSLDIEIDFMGDSFLEWLQTTGKPIIHQLLNSGTLSPDMVSYIENVIIVEMETVSVFLEIMMDTKAVNKYKNYTIGDFLILVNKAYRFLSDRSGMQWNIEWKSKLKTDTLLFCENNGDFNACEIVEGLARLSEYKVLKQFNDVDENDLDKWKRENLQGRYKRLFGFSLEHYRLLGIELESLDHIGHARSVLQMALCARIDICCATDDIRELYIEQEFPWFRAKLAKSTENLLYLIKSSLESLQMVLQKNKIFDQQSNWAGESSGSHEVIDRLMRYHSMHFKLVEQQFIKGVRLMLESFQHRKQVGEELDNLPLVVEYSDQFVFLNQPDYGENELLFSLMVPLHIYFLQKLSLNILNGRATDDPGILAEKTIYSIKRLITAFFRAGLLKEQKEEGLSLIFEGLSNSIRLFFSKNMFSRFLNLPEKAILWFAPDPDKTALI